MTDLDSAALRVRCLASTRVAERARCEESRFSQKKDAEPRDEQTRDHDDEQELGLTRELSDDDSSISTSESDSDSESSYASTTTNPGAQSRYTSCIQEAQLSPDGTCVFTSDYNRTFSVYPIDTDILSETGTRALKPYAQFTSSNPIWAFAANPLFNLNDASSTHVLVSQRDSYINLHNALWDTTRIYESNESQAAKTTSPVNISTPLTSYKLINHLNEAVTAPLSLVYSHSSAHFFAGSQNAIAIFDLEHTDNPIHTIKTIPSRNSKLKGGGRGFKGYISALSLSPATSTCQAGLLAAGARTRYIGIYDPVSGSEITHFSLPGTLDGKKLRSENLSHVMGDGVSSLKWSPCGKYLYVAERMSDVLLIYDVRNFSLTLGYCVGRRAATKQKLGFDVWNSGASMYDVEGIGHEVWAGGVDGRVRVWKDPWRREGAVEADEVVCVGGGGGIGGEEEEVPVVATLVHPYGSLAVAACGAVEVGDGSRGGGIRRGGGMRPKYREWGSLSILGLGGN
ncbi:WD40 repeat-like protein [Dothidotthia symphoricarpi CBS 119687]|uniref:WD40 repeat-like protein n=1 Tax=Dothidotthia symphoricarpi CBS 119687 TaxID=1392245 RepID=A0A6A6AKX1_9PLEO|nr:WD40 repeat-like protein [Dothidotthia symphoricarpi CBS 119687]KAF2131517.1 WD40 repeat-like protein [Dothidotthia symphoricarpi CBS 119687]